MSILDRVKEFEALDAAYRGRRDLTAIGLGMLVIATSWVVAARPSDWIAAVAGASPCLVLLLSAHLLFAQRDARLAHEARERLREAWTIEHHAKLRWLRMHITKAAAFDSSSAFVVEVEFATGSPAGVVVQGQLDARGEVMPLHLEVEVNRRDGRATTVKLMAETGLTQLHVPAPGTGTRASITFRQEQGPSDLGFDIHGDFVRPLYYVLRARHDCSPEPIGAYGATEVRFAPRSAE